LLILIAFRSDRVVFLGTRSFQVRDEGSRERSSVQMVVSARFILMRGDEILDPKPGMASDMGDMDVFPVDGLVVVKILFRGLDVSDEDILISWNSA